MAETKTPRKRKKPQSTVAKTLAYLRACFFVAQKVEQPVFTTPRKDGKSPLSPMVRRDLFGFADVAALGLGMPGTLYVQCGAASAARSKVEGLLDNPVVETALLAGNTIEVHGWKPETTITKAKNGPDVKIILTLEMIERRKIQKARSA